MVKTALIIVAAGKGIRAGSETPKQYWQLAGHSVLSYSLKAWPQVDLIQGVIGPDHHDLYAQALAEMASPPSQLLEPVVGGYDRQASVLAGLEAIALYQPDIVLIHDAARPLMPESVFAAVAQKAHALGGAAPGLSLVDSIHQVAEGRVVQPVDRERLQRVQTPQGFNFKTLLAAHRQAANTTTRFSDDIGLAHSAGIPVALVAGHDHGFKLTTAQDLKALEQMLLPSPTWCPRTGFGFDVHAFGENSYAKGTIVLGGVAIPHDQQLKGHSDADVVLHAITDALLGALNAGDIGQHFPPSDPQWHGQDSRFFLEKTLKLAHQAQARLSNLDVVIVCERPKIGPHRAALQAKIADILTVPQHKVSIKATTSEQLGFTGRGEGIACYATVTLLVSEEAIALSSLSKLAMSCRELE